jgi:hypothetical protein
VFSINASTFSVAWDVVAPYLAYCCEENSDHIASITDCDEQARSAQLRIWMWLRGAGTGQPLDDAEVDRLMAACGIVLTGYAEFGGDRRLSAIEEMFLRYGTRCCGDLRVFGPLGEAVNAIVGVGVPFGDAEATAGAVADRSSRGAFDRATLRAYAWRDFNDGYNGYWLHAVIQSPCSLDVVVRGRYWAWVQEQKSRGLLTLAGYARIADACRVLLRYWDAHSDVIVDSWDRLVCEIAAAADFRFFDCAEEVGFVGAVAPGYADDESFVGLGFGVDIVAVGHLMGSLPDAVSNAEGAVDALVLQDWLFGYVQSLRTRGMSAGAYGKVVFSCSRFLARYVLFCSPASLKPGLKAALEYVTRAGSAAFGCKDAAALGEKAAVSGSRVVSLTLDRLGGGILRALSAWRTAVHCEKEKSRLEGLARAYGVYWVFSPNCGYRSCDWLLRSATGAVREIVCHWSTGFSNADLKDDDKMFFECLFGVCDRLSQYSDEGGALAAEAGGIDLSSFPSPYIATASDLRTAEFHEAFELVDPYLQYCRGTNCRGLLALVGCAGANERAFYEWARLALLDGQSSDSVMQVALACNTVRWSWSSVRPCEALDEATLYFLEGGMMYAQCAGEGMLHGDDEGARAMVKSSRYTNPSSAEALQHGEKAFVCALDAVREYVGFFLSESCDEVRRASSVELMEALGRVKFVAYMCSQHSDSEEACVRLAKARLFRLNCEVVARGWEAHHSLSGLEYGCYVFFNAASLSDDAVFNYTSEEEARSAFVTDNILHPPPSPVGASAALKRDFDAALECVRPYLDLLNGRWSDLVRGDASDGNSVLKGEFALVHASYLKLPQPFVDSEACDELARACGTIDNFWHLYRESVPEEYRHSALFRGGRLAFSCYGRYSSAGAACTWLFGGGSLAALRASHVPTFEAYREAKGRGSLGSSAAHERGSPDAPGGGGGAAGSDSSPNPNPAGETTPAAHPDQSRLGTAGSGTVAARVASGGTPACGEALRRDPSVRDNAEEDQERKRTAMSFDRAFDFFRPYVRYFRGEHGSWAKRVDTSLRSQAAQVVAYDWLHSCTGTSFASLIQLARSMCSSVLNQWDSVVQSNRASDDEKVFFEGILALGDRVHSNVRPGSSTAATLFPGVKSLYASPAVPSCTPSPVREGERVSPATRPSTPPRPSDSGGSLGSQGHRDLGGVSEDDGRKLRSYISYCRTSLSAEVGRANGKVTGALMDAVRLWVHRSLPREGFEKVWGSMMARCQRISSHWDACRVAFGFDDGEKVFFDTVVELGAGVYIGLK